MQKITPYLWFDNQAEEAVNFYTSCFQHGTINNTSRYPDEPMAGPTAGMEGKVLTVAFDLAGLSFVALNGGPHYKFTPAISFFVNCESKEELSSLWEKLIDGGTALMPLQAYPFSELYGWLHDRYGVCWQLNLSEGPQNIVPFLMFVGGQNGHAEEAMKLYTSLSENSSVDFVAPNEAGNVQQAAFRLDGQDFMAIDGGTDHNFTFTEAISFYVNCDSQADVDHYWHALSAVPESEQCGWLKDKFGVSWQIIPDTLIKLMGDPDPEKSRRVMEAMLQMKKIDIAGLQAAYAE